MNSYSLIIFLAIKSAFCENVQTLYTCSEPLDMVCPENHVISMVRANYGRFSISVCNPKRLTNISTNCASLTTLHTINKM